MIEPSFATLIILTMGIILMFVIPFLDSSKRFGKYISLRYTLVVVTTLMALGCVLDFSHLGESSRNITIMGGLILVGVFVAVRSLEKLKLGSKTIEVTARKGDAEITTTITGEKSPLAKGDNDGKA